QTSSTADPSSLSLSQHSPQSEEEGRRRNRPSDDALLGPHVGGMLTASGVLRRRPPIAFLGGSDETRDSTNLCRGVGSFCRTAGVCQYFLFDRHRGGYRLSHGQRGRRRRDPLLGGSVPTKGRRWVH